jgi:hypothetical protein
MGDVMKGKMAGLHPLDNSQGGHCCAENSGDDRRRRSNYFLNKPEDNIAAK